ncbi:hypothetical protein [Rhodococcus sp. MEB064]|uniref:hypothetical protein n=1 Tax=Rhodococcus sp. MEB064 TaxID=1587522 RepID=UPI0005AC7FD2|nr:hypothetical protein RU01_18235 [Rhodococcus sp. MEB064]
MIPGLARNGDEFRLEVRSLAVRHHPRSSDEDRVRIEFSDKSVPDMIVGADEDVTFHVVDIDRPDLAQFGEDGYVVRMEPR